MRYMIQHDRRDCGASCFRMVADYYGYHVSLSRCRELTNTDRDGTNLFGIAQAASAIGLNAKGYETDPEELLNAVTNGKIQTPFVAHVVNEDRWGHFVVVVRLGSKNTILADPARGKVRVPLADFFNVWTGNLMTFQITERFSKNRREMHPLLKYASLLKGVYHKLTVILGMSIAISLIGMASAFVFKIVMDPGDPTAYAQATSTQTESQSLGLLFGGIMVLYILRALLSFFRGRLVAKVSSMLESQISQIYYESVMNIPVEQVQYRHVGEYLSRYDDIDTIRQAISGATVTLVLDTSMAIVCGAILASQSAVMFICTLPTILAYVAVVMAFRSPVRKGSFRLMEREARMQSWLKESLDGIETIKAANAERKACRTAKDRLSEFITAAYRLALVTVTQESIAEAVQAIGTAAILWMGFTMVSSGNITIGSLITFYALLGYFIEPVSNLVELQPMLQQATVAAERIDDIVSITPESNSGSTLERQIDRWQVINASFRYGSRELTLKEVSIDINRGEKIALVGESGSGKTTLAKLLLRFYVPESGSITIDGDEVEHFNLSTYRTRVAYVEQNPILFAGSIRSNLLLTNPNATEKEIERACTLSHACEFIEKLPGKYEFILDENGSNLSGGQRQRLAIARALIKHPDLLIFDEATSQLDALAEGAIRDSILRQEGLTCLVIAHRLSTIRHCDRIYVLENGKVAEFGTHDELMAIDGLYSRHWQGQLGL